MDRTTGQQSSLAKVAEAGLAGDRQRLELLLISLVRSLKRESPEVSRELGEILAQQSVNPSGLRWKEIGPPPVDGDEGMALVQIETPESVPEPIFSPPVTERITQFLRERRESRRLLEEGVLPPGSLLLVGLPGTGKTMLARWMAEQLALPLVIQDLATSISSFLGKTGFNLRRTLDYARSRPCVLLLDEFDAVAKRRDDNTEVGELKRIVNVLLKELEDWPLQSVLIAATNHPDLLDPAIRRRFNLVLELPLPGEKEREAILTRAGGRFSKEIPAELLTALAKALEGATGSDLESLIQAAIRRHVLTEMQLVRSIVGEVLAWGGEHPGGKHVGALMRTIHAVSGEAFSMRELAEMFGRSVSTVQHHLKKGEARA